MTDYELPQEELGFSSVAELLQRVPGVEMKRPPKASSVMVYRTKDKSPSREEKEEKIKKEEAEKVRELHTVRASSETLRHSNSFCVKLVCIPY